MQEHKALTTEAHELSDSELDHVSGGRSHHSHRNAAAGNDATEVSAKDLAIFSAEASVFGAMASSASTAVKSNGDASKEVARGG